MSGQEGKSAFDDIGGMIAVSRNVWKMLKSLIITGDLKVNGAIKNAAGTTVIPANSGALPVVGESGTFTANGVTPVAVAATSVTANSQILYTLKTVGGTVGAPQTVTITPGVGFTVKSQVSDTSIYNYKVLN